MRYVPFNRETNEVFESHIFPDALQCRAWLDYVVISDELYPEEQALADLEPGFRKQHCDHSGNLRKAQRLNFNYKPLQADLDAEGYVEIFYEGSRGWLGYRQNDVMPVFLPNQGIPGGSMYSTYDEESKTFDIVERF